MSNLLGATLPEVLWHNGVGSAPALVLAQGDGGRSPFSVVTYENLRITSKQLKENLEEIGLGATSVVGLLASHSLQTSIALVDLTTSGFACAPLNPALQSEGIVAALKDAGAEILIVSLNLRLKGCLCQHQMFFGAVIKEFGVFYFCVGPSI